MQVVSDGNEDYDMSEKQAYDRLIDGKDIRYKTEINHDQRCIISAVETSINHFRKKKIDLYVANQFLLTFIDMGASIDRKSRKEVVDSLKAKTDFLERQLIADKQNNQLR